MSVSITSAPASTSKQPKKKLASKAKPKAKATTILSRPSWKDIIKECIAANTEDIRRGVSRNTIKKYAEEAYKIEVSGLSLSQLNRAITSGTEAGIFILPKGPSGKIKLAPKAKPLTSASKENSEPTKKAAPTVAKKVAVPKAKATKKATAPSKRGAVKQVATAAATKKRAGTKKV